MRRTFLFEIKDPSKPPSQRKLTAREMDLFDTWTGQIAVVESTEEVLSIVTGEP